MSSPNSHGDPSRAAPGKFQTTRWSLILAARDADDPAARDALGDLCTTYWYPIYAFIRRKGHDADAALDLTQEFFARFLEKDALASVDRNRGRFRSFLLAACTHFLANEHDRQRALKRGGGRSPVSINLPDAEGRYRLEPAHGITPERLFERRWALTLLDRVLTQLEQEYGRDGKGALYEHLKAALLGGKGVVSYAQVAGVLGMTEAAVKKAAQRLRDRYREVLRLRIAETLDDPIAVDDEIRALFAALAS